MKQEGTVTALQTGGLTFLFVFSTTLAYLIGPLAKEAGSDGWICIVLGAVAGTALAIPPLSFALRRPTAYLGSFGERIVGKPVHKCILFLTSTFYLHLAAYILREFTDFFVPSFLKETPPVAVAILVLTAAAFLAQVGVSGSFRFAQGCFLVIGLFFLLKPLFFVPYLDTPIWREFARIHDWKTLWKQTYGIIPWYGELTMLAYIAPLFASRRKIRAAVWIGSMAGTYILLTEFLLIVLFFGPKLAGALSYPALDLTGFVHLGDFLRNMNALIVSIWFMGYFVKLSVVFAVGTLLFSEMLGVRDPKPLTAPLGALVVCFSLVLARNPVELAGYFDASWATYALAVEGLAYVYPLVSWARGRAGRRPASPSA
ncbi:hypothetical protein J19TS2_09730 [Cohnella xylanilytica]|uniref:GerAB/ArcD/ProY family transporter n=1 Tax=Cohnella xylanilytica TaxID=557555 RepID=A0A841U4A0_9BACL|nr:GerAB/ArcD/ProY family transporter [Cohnella xylanilytica]MBB6694599.1 GerAB/ArcD/ProY family transporter [Cohnella xylanilytica]GIO11418.1 hypothetical protein J19TS2_09730 [Cohnella xylanilytica]